MILIVHHVKMKVKVFHSFFARLLNNIYEFEGTCKCHTISALYAIHLTPQVNWHKYIRVSFIYNVKH